MAEVYVARPRHSAKLPPLMAVKQLRPESRSQPEFRRMFTDEALVASRLDHPNIVRTYEWGACGESGYIAMELVRGLSLAEVLRTLRERDEKLPASIALWITEQVCCGLAYAHGLLTDSGAPAGLVHRDITPHNIVLGFDGRVKIVDFGIAKSTLQEGHTAAGFMKGKIGYVAPEQITMPAKVDHRADVYALGVCLWECFAGRHMHSPELPEVEVLYRVARGLSPTLDTVRPGLPEKLLTIVAKATATDAIRRYQSAGELAASCRRARRTRANVTSASFGTWLESSFSVEHREQEHYLAMLEQMPSLEITLEEDDFGELDAALADLLDAPLVLDAELDPAEWECEGLSTLIHFSVDVDEPIVAALSTNGAATETDELEQMETLRLEELAPPIERSAPTLVDKGDGFRPRIGSAADPANHGWASATRDGEEMGWPAHRPTPRALRAET